MSTPEFSRPIRLRQIDARPVSLTADEAERGALAERFDLRAITALSADITLERNGDEVRADGRFKADIIQICAVSGEDFPTSLSERITLLFVPAGPDPEPTGDEPIDIEFDSQERDEIEYRGDTIDLGEAVAQSLALAIDPYAEGPHADAARERGGLASDAEPRGPLADALAALQKKS